MTTIDEQKITDLETDRNMMKESLYIQTTVIIIACFYLSTIDGLLTFYAVEKSGVVELNPIVNYWIQAFPEAWLIIRQVVVTIVYWILKQCNQRIYEIPLKDKKRNSLLIAKRLNVVLYIVLFINLQVVLYHIYYIFS